MEIDVARTAVRHHEAETFLVVEELDLAFDHGARGTVIAEMAAAAAAKAAATEPVAAAKAVAAAKTVTAEIAPGSPRGRLGGGKIHAMDVHHLQPALAVGQVADDGRALRHLAVACRLQSGGMAEGVAAAVQCDETVTLGRVEPLHLARRGSLREGPGPIVVVLCHLNRRHTPSRLMNKRPHAGCEQGVLRHDDYRNTGLASRPQTP